MKAQEKNLLTWILVSVILLDIFLFWNPMAFGQKWTSEQKELWASVQANWETFKKGDVEAALAIKHEEILSWDSDNPDPLKKEILQKAYKNWFDMFKPTFVKLKPLNIHIFNNVANVFYLYRWESANREYSNRGRMLETWVKQDNKWLEIGSLSSSCDTLPSCPYGW